MDKFKQTIEWRGAGTKLPTGGASKKAGGGGMSPPVYMLKEALNIRCFIGESAIMRDNHTCD
jgi:hypothetical protein